MHITHATTVLADAIQTIQSRHQLDRLIHHAHLRDRELAVRPKSAAERLRDSELVRRLMDGGYQIGTEARREVDRTQDPYAGLPDQRDWQVAALYRTGVSMEEAGRPFRLSAARVRTVLRRTGQQPRPRGGAHGSRILRPLLVA